MLCNMKHVTTACTTARVTACVPARGTACLAASEHKLLLFGHLVVSASGLLQLSLLRVLLSFHKVCAI